ncbi:MAG: RNA polymerase sigma factor (sigma-70 family) [Gammaproteobacteria bacterium]|jgi:RNA polymerase sigma factor (sigma-70 family)
MYHEVFRQDAERASLSLQSNWQKTLGNKSSHNFPYIQQEERSTKMVSENDKREFFQIAASEVMDKLYGTAMRFTRDSTNAEDLVAETFEKAWKYLDKLQDRESFDAWIMRILSNTFLSNWRQQKNRGKYFDDDIEVSDLQDKDGLYAKLHQPFLLWWGTPEQTFVNKLLREDIQKAMDSISESYREVVILVEILGYTYDEVAQAIEVPVGTVRSRLNRGRRLLQKALWETARDAGLVAQTDSREVN